MTGKTDADLLHDLAPIAAEIATRALNNLAPGVRKKLAGRMDAGEVYLHVTVSPSYQIVVAFASDDPNRPPLELARLVGTLPEAIKLH